MKRPGVRITDPKGKEIGFIPTGEPNQKIDADHPGKGFPSNVEFGVGEGKNMLYVTVDLSLYRIKLNARGYHPQFEKHDGSVSRNDDVSQKPTDGLSVGVMETARAGVAAGTLIASCCGRCHAEGPKATPARDAVKTFKIADGLEVRLVASEPLIRQPLSISFDDRGRLWVLQYIQYPNPEGLRPVAVDEYLRTKYDRRPDPPPKGPRGHDVIAILEDTNGDGVYDRAKTFLTGLNLASGMAIGYGGVFVAQPPYLLFYRDANGDDDSGRRSGSAADRFRHGGRAMRSPIR